MNKEISVLQLILSAEEAKFQADRFATNKIDFLNLWFKNSEVHGSVAERVFKYEKI